MKLWDKGIDTDKKIESFTIGKDRELDLFLAPFDIAGTMAHSMMLKEVGLLSEEDLQALIPELKKMYKNAQEGGFEIEEGIEDVHSQVELLLTRELGDTGKKVHSGRSRNDQVLLDLKLFARDGIMKVTRAVEDLFDVLQKRSDAHKDDLLPGYTHLQVAMPSSFGLWFGAYAESLVDDLHFLQAAWRVVNQNPLGAAAGYGNSFPLDRGLTTRLLGFDDLSYNVVYAQMGRGKMERLVAMALSSIASTLSRLAMDACLYMSQNFGFVKLPDAFTTGSSIMPHKKNPDVFELLRARCNKLMDVPNQIAMITGNLPSGYFRDMQITKEVFIPAFEDVLSCIDLMTTAVSKMEISKDIMKDERYKYAFSVEEVNRRVLSGMTFRDAYKQVGMEIEKGEFLPDTSVVNHTHEGSIGNLCNAEIKDKMKQVVAGFQFERVQDAMNKLLT
ncbi:argininosuccinate lyase [Marinilabilia salmonicolor]|jgi:argininosuccinate lyase|uniref:Argininosuccinate lyase n=1 Tax=Marinilabilia salmonicolor TaxID=989 RepID=A0A2T0XT11_9BACT|nr:argininosuccinate lyase [Marinilabilia salmonicolor]PRZ02079.1 argininosuccinate lyase [Marinilabilia salmonicolor]RCW39513.1 argininosuccinate lyase [Marinilabilia salmonicolor]